MFCSSCRTSRKARNPSLPSFLWRLSGEAFSNGYIGAENAFACAENELNANKNSYMCRLHVTGVLTTSCGSLDHGAHSRALMEALAQRDRTVISTEQLHTPVRHAVPSPVGVLDGAPVGCFTWGGFGKWNLEGGSTLYVYGCGEDRRYVLDNAQPGISSDAGSVTRGAGTAQTPR